MVAYEIDAPIEVTEMSLTRHKLESAWSCPER
jgi:hypothetical protein